MKIFQKCNKVLGHIPVKPKKKKKKENGILAVFKSLSTFTHRVSGQRCHFLSAAALPLLPPVFLSSPPIVHHTKMDIGVLCPNNTNKIFRPKENGTEFLVMRQKKPQDLWTRFRGETAHSSEEVCGTIRKETWGEPTDTLTPKNIRIGLTCQHRGGVF